MDLDSLRSECTVSGVLHFVFRVSQVAGIAPVKFERCRGSWCLSMSRFYLLYDFLVVFIIQLFTAIVSFSHRDGMVEGFEYRGNTGFTRIFTMVILTVQTTVGFTIVCTAYNRLRHTIDCLAQLEQINKEIDRVFRPIATSERKLWLLVICLIIHGYVGTFMEYNMYLYDVVTSDKEVLFISFLMVASYINLIHLQLFPIQFFLVIMRLVSIQERLNNCLKFTFQKIYTDRFKTDAILLVLLRNIYCSLCCVIRQLNDCNGIPLIMVFLFVMRNFISTPYTLVAVLYYIDVEFPITKALCSVAWSTVCLSMLVLIVEPCHRAHVQLNLTKELVYQMMRHTPREASAINHELKMFKRHILLNPVSFCPMQLLLFDRHVLIAVFTTVVRYISVIINL